MLLAVLSDIHGNLPALEAVLEDMAQFTLAGIIAAGDYVGCPWADETIERLSSLHPWAIRGNTDINLIKYDEKSVPQAWHTSRQFALARWIHQHIRSSSLDFLKRLPEQISIEIPGTISIRVVHGSPRDPYESIFPDQNPDSLASALAQIPEKVCVFGHTHIPWKQDCDTKQALNPGAVCGALNGDVRAQYALLLWEKDHWQVEHRAVPYDLVRLRRGFEDSGLLAKGGALAKAFLLSNETGLNVGEFFLSYAYKLATEAGYRDCEVIPDPVWDQAAATFGWANFGR
jgi:putative phosphoesterase